MPESKDNLVKPLDMLHTLLLENSGNRLRDMEWAAFVKESNRIEGIMRPPTDKELHAFANFMGKKTISIGDLIHFVDVYQPDAKLRDEHGLNVIVGSNYRPPDGGPHIRAELKQLLARISEMHPYEFHVAYETLHPFTDGNGRSGRMLWAWRMQRFPLGFLRHFYYQALNASQGRSPGLAPMSAVERRLLEWSAFSAQDLRLRMGELTSQEVRTVKAALKAITSAR